jgi:hypothetical protein
VFYDGGGGAILFGGWFDSEFGVRCTFTRTRNDQFRCLPAGQTAVWADATCSMPVWRTSCPANLPPYVTAWLGPGASVYPLGAPYTGAVRDTSAGVCVDMYDRGGSNWGGSYAYGVGAEIPSERFVAATIRSVPIDDGKLYVRTLQGDDGSSQVAVEVNGQFAKRAPQLSAYPAGTFSFLGSGRLRAPSYFEALGQVLVESRDGFFDSQADVPCRPIRFADGLRCIPWHTPGVNKEGPYLDAGCTTLLSEDTPGSSRSHTWAFTKDCSGTTAYTLGDVVTPPVVYFKRSTCEPRTPSARVVYRPATPAADSPWATLTERVE